MKLKLVLVFLVFFLLIIVGHFTSPKISRANIPLPDIDVYLTETGISTGEEVFKSYLTDRPNDVRARFSLGALQFFGAVEELGRGLYRYGLDSSLGQRMGIPFLRLPLPTNPNPEEIDYSKWRDLFDTFNQNLQEAEATLARLSDAKVKLPIRFAQIRLDLNGDERLSDEEEFWQIYRLYNRSVGATPTEEGRELSIAFDTGDVYWLRGYCHLLMAMTDTILAYDTRELFHHFGALFFPQVQTPYSLPPISQETWMGWVDAIAAIHLFHFDPVEPQRLQSALERGKSVVELSRQSWDSIMTETDNDREWIPNPTQNSVVPAAVTADQIKAWQTFLNEMEEILTGKKLLPHWRFTDGSGINLQRVFLQPETFDLVLWVQGSAALPYLESGELTAGETWNELVSVFGGNFIGFAIWFN